MQKEGPSALIEISSEAGRKIGGIYTVISSNNQNHYICYTGTTHTHCSKCLMARRI